MRWVTTRTPNGAVGYILREAVLIAVPTVNVGVEVLVLGLANGERSIVVDTPDLRGTLGLPLLEPPAPARIQL